MINSNADLYATVEELALTLGAAGEQGLAVALRDALAIGCLPGEVLGETRLRLKEVRKSPLYGRLDSWPLDSETSAKVIEAERAYLSLE